MTNCMCVTPQGAENADRHECGMVTVWLIAFLKACCIERHIVQKVSLYLGRHTLPTGTLYRLIYCFQVAQGATAPLASLEVTIVDSECNDSVCIGWHGLVHSQ